METAKATLIFSYNRLLLYLDRGRCFVLRRTLGVPFILKIYSDRGLRVFVLSLISIAVNLIFSLTAPYLVLFVGPLLFGFPHLLATYVFLPRFFSQTMNKVSLPADFALDRYVIGICLIFSAIYKVFIENTLAIQIQAFVPLIEIAMTIGFFYWRIKRHPMGSRQTLLGTCELIVYAAVVWIFPFESLAFLILFHNFQAFLFWCVAAKENKHLIYPILSSMIFIFICALIGFGFMDHLHDQISSIFTSRLFSISYPVVPIVLNSIFLTRIAIAAAFGQGIHYFIWLKAIPDELRVEPLPLTFRKSLGRLVKTAGSFAPAVMIGMTISFILIASFDPERARILYLCVASAHGFMELGVGIAIFNRLLAGD